MLFLHRHSVAKQGGCFWQNHFVDVFISLFVCQHDNFKTIKHLMVKLGGLYQKLGRVWISGSSAPFIGTKMTQIDRVIDQEAFEKCWAHSPLLAATRRLFYIAIHQVSLLSHAATVACRQNWSFIAEMLQFFVFSRWRLPPSFFWNRKILLAVWVARVETH